MANIKNSIGVFLAKNKLISVISALFFDVLISILLIKLCLKANMSTFLIIISTIFVCFLISLFFVLLNANLRIKYQDELSYVEKPYYVLSKEEKKNKRYIWFGKGFIWFFLLLMYLPILLLVCFSFTTSDQVGIWSGFSFQLYVDLVNNKELMKAVWNTLLIAVVSAIVSTILGTLGAVGSFYSSKKVRKMIDTANQLPIVNAEIVIALSLAVLAVSLSWKFSFFTLLIGHVVLTVAYVYLNVKPRLLQMDPFVYEAALDLGARPRFAMYKVILPEIIPGILSGFMISFTLSLDDFVITQYLKKPSFETISTYIQKIIAKHPIPPEVRALTTIIFLAVLIVSVGSTIYNNKKAKQIVKKRRGVN